MELLREFMGVYRHAFHPLVVLVGCSLLLIYYEWSLEGAPHRVLAGRVGTLLGIEAVAVSPIPVYLLVTDRSVTSLTLGNDWRSDLLTVASLLTAAGLIRFVWSRKDWGSATEGAMTVIAAIAVPYALLSLVWNISGHVTFSLVPTLYLAFVDRRFWPLLVIPVVMIPNRPIVGMHTWLQSVGGFVLGTVGVVVAYRRVTPSADADER